MVYIWQTVRFSIRKIFSFGSTKNQTADSKPRSEQSHSFQLSTLRGSTLQPHTYIFHPVLSLKNRGSWILVGEESSKVFPKYVLYLTSTQLCIFSHTLLRYTAYLFGHSPTSTESTTRTTPPFVNYLPPVLPGVDGRP